MLDKLKNYDLLEWLVLAVALSYFILPYFPRHSLEFLGKSFFLSQVLMLGCVALLPWFFLTSAALRERIRAIIALRALVLPLFLSMVAITVSTLIANGFSSVIFSRTLSIIAILLMFGLFSLLSQKFIDRFLSLSAWFTILASLLGYLQFFGGQAFAPAFYLNGRGEIFAVGFATHSSDFGLHLAAFLMIFWFLFIFNYGQKRMLWGTVFFIGVPVLVLTFSRAAWLAVAIVGLFALAWLLQHHKDKIKTVLLSLLAASFLALSMLVAALYFGPSPSWEQVGTDKAHGQKLIDQRLTIADDSSRSRALFHKAASDLLLESPQNFLIGLGMWGFSDNWPRFDPNEKIKDHIDPHSTFLEVFVSGGLVAFGLFLLFLWQLLRAAYKSIHRSFLTAPLLAAFGTVLINGVMHTHLYTKYMWIIAGLIVSLIVIERSQVKMNRTNPPAI